MKQYGKNQATEFTKKQIGVIYYAAKAGDLKVEKWLTSYMYDLADFYGVDWNGSVAKEEQAVLHILSDVFAKNFASAQERLDSFSQSLQNCFTEKKRRGLDRRLVG